MHQRFQKILNSLNKRFSNLPSLTQWQLLIKTLTKKEKVILAVLFFCLIASLSFISYAFYFKKTSIEPTQGGTYIEGAIGQPRFINPALAVSDTDRDLVEILFSGLMKYDKNGKIIPDLAREYRIEQEGRVYQVFLRNDIFWHDGQKITADDVVSTIKIIQNPAYKSPEAVNWVGITVKKISDLQVTFGLENAYFPFLERLTLKLLPRHIFQEILPENFALTNHNLQPVGSGPFRFQKLKQNESGQIESLTLTRNQNYYGQIPFLKELCFRFFGEQEELNKAIKKGEVYGAAIANPKDINILKGQTRTAFSARLPRYFAVFFNSDKNEILEQEKVREALNLAVNKQEILTKVIGGLGRIVHSPILPEIFGFNTPTETPEFNLQKASELLEDAGLIKIDGRLIIKQIKIEFDFKKNLELGDKGKEVEKLQECLALLRDIYPAAEITGYFGKLTEKAVILFQEKYREEILDPWDFEKGTGIAAKTTRKKLNEICNAAPEEIQPVKLSLTTINQPLLLDTAEFLKSQWEKLGLEITIEKYDFNELSQEFIKPREYEMLLFGEILGIMPDPFPFWHSSKIKDPGLNLSLYKNEEADKLLKKAREARTFDESQSYLEEFQEIIIKDNPAVLLYSPDFIYLVSNKIKGVELNLLSDPSKRFIDVENWYTKTKRVWK